MASAGYVVHWDAVKAYATVVTEQETSLSQVNSALKGVHLQPDSFGKLPEANDLYQAYTQHADECLEITAKLPQQIGQVGEGLNDTAQAYAQAEEDLVQLFQHLGLGAGAGAGGGASAGSGAGGGASGALASLAQETAASYDWTRKSSTALPAAQAPSGGQKGLEGLLEEAVNWVINHVPELPKLLNDVTGDTGALIAAANVWVEQGNRVNAVIQALREGALNLPQEWAGEGSEAFGTFMTDVIQGLTQLVTVMGQTAKVLEDAAREAAMAHDLIVDIITQVVEWVATNLLIDAATLGLATAFEAAGTAAFLAMEAEKAEKVSVTLAKFLSELERLVKGMEELKKGVTEASGLGKLAKFGGVSGKLAKLLKPGGTMKLASALKDGKAVEWGVDHGIRMGLKHAAPDGLGLKGGLIHAGTTAAKDLAGKPAGDLLGGNTQTDLHQGASQVGHDLLHGNVQQAGADAHHTGTQVAHDVTQTGVPKAEHDLRQDGAQVGAEPVQTPQAPPASRIEQLLTPNGGKEAEAAPGQG